MIIAMEGIDGSGKTTQAKLLTDWLRAGGHRVFTTRWNSSPIVTLATHKAKKTRSLTPRLHSLLAAADFTDRLENEILPALAQGDIIVADRWYYTACARDGARGVSWKLAELYETAPEPDICFHLQTSVETALSRILAEPERRLKHYESGMDLGLSTDIQESFRLFQAKVLDRYDDFSLRWIDGELPIEAQQDQIRAAVEVAMKANAAVV